MCESNDDGGGVVCSSAFPYSFAWSCTFIGRAFVLSRTGVVLLCLGSGSM